MAHVVSDKQHPTISRLFDVRLVIGALFVVYGALLTVAGINTSAAARAKADGIAINLWTGLAMLALGMIFLVWMRLRPLLPAEVGRGDDATTDPGDGGT